MNGANSVKVLPPLLAILFGAFVLLFSSAPMVSAQELKLDPAKVKGPDECGECHTATVKLWKKTKHATTFKKLPRKKASKKIAKAMGLKRIKAGSDCLSCHFTSAIPKGKVKPIAGISCESCHGEGSDYIKVHSDYGGKGKTIDNEDPAHKKQRIAASDAAGMIRIVNLYQIADNCYGCHTVPNEKLVNVGGHPAGSDFDLVAWSQGEIRHNVWYSKSNDEASANRKRMMYVVGISLDLIHAMRGVALATADGTYAAKMIKRAEAARDALASIAGKISAPEIGKVVAAAKGVKLALGNAATLKSAADKASTAAKAFAAKYDGKAFAALDSMIPGADKYKGQSN